MGHAVAIPRPTGNTAAAHSSARPTEGGKRGGGGGGGGNERPKKDLSLSRSVQTSKKSPRIKQGFANRVRMTRRRKGLMVIKRCGSWGFAITARGRLPSSNIRQDIHPPVKLISFKCPNLSGCWQSLLREWFCNLGTPPKLKPLNGPLA